MPDPLSSDIFETVVLPHLDAAHNLARWLMRDAASAEDVLQEAMLRALTYFPSFKGVNARGWLLQIVRNTAYASMSLNRGGRPRAADEYARRANRHRRATPVGG